MKSKLITFKELIERGSKGTMYFHCDYEDAVLRIVPAKGGNRFFVKLNRGGAEFEVNQNSGIPLQVMSMPMEITEEEYFNF